MILLSGGEISWQFIVFMAGLNIVATVPGILYLWFNNHRQVKGMWRRVTG